MIVGCECLSLCLMGWGGVPESRAYRGAQQAPSPLKGSTPQAPVLLADVLPGEDFAAGLAFKATQVPLLFQGQERLPVLDISPAASTIWKKAATSGYSTFVLLNPSMQACSEPQCAPITHSINIYLSTISFRVCSLHETFPSGLTGPILTQDGNVINLRGSKGMDVLHQFISLGVM